jgi:hypothetical protein
MELVGGALLIDSPAAERGDTSEALPPKDWRKPRFFRRFALCFLI